MSKKWLAVVAGGLVATGALPAAASADSGGGSRPPASLPIRVTLDCRGTVTLVEWRDRVLFSQAGDPTCPAGTGSDFQHNETMIVDALRP
ncbi:MAG: hypothetical protein QOJ21_1436 [Solirubrobacteraceae bacterium]|jgi:hypothetical protein|nr:hypothetical protein [Solirubrobacteraceae bacterium]